MKKIAIIFAVLFSLVVVGVVMGASEFWAVNVEGAEQGDAYYGSISSLRSTPAAVLGAYDNDGKDESSFFSLGKEGIVTVKLASPVDTTLEIYEATWGCNANYQNEKADVYVSPDKTNWTYLGLADNIGDCYSGSGFISTFDLNSQCIQYVKVVDAGVGSGSGTVDGFDVDAIGGSGSCKLSQIVEIDIKPGSDPSCFNSNEHGVIPVAIFGSAEFDVYQIDVGTVNLDGAAVAVRGKADKSLSAYEDVNGDGYMDLVVKIEDMGGYAPGDSWATVTGFLFDGTPIEGTGDICITQ